MKFQTLFNPKAYKNFILRQLIPERKPDFLIVGAQKAGTSSLHHYLSQHPSFLAARTKEIRYFDRDENYAKGEKWYLKDLKSPDTLFKKGLLFESTPEYMYRSYVPERIHAFDACLKIIIVLRDPIKRAYSSWNMYRDFPISRKRLPRVFDSGYIKDRDNNILKELYQSDNFPSFEEAVAAEMKKIEENSDLEEPSFIRRGIYLPQIKKYHELFGKDQVLVIGFKDLVEDTKGTLNDVLRFLDLEESEWDFIVPEKKNSRSYPEKISPEMEKQLRDFYKPYNEALFDYLETKINW